MGLILRVDVDKPYGRKSIQGKILSKIREDFYLPAWKHLGYLSATYKFIDYCNRHDIRGVFYFRNCTAPNKKVMQALRTGGHQLGFHAENTRSLGTFKLELERFEKNLAGEKVSSFTKHGSGEIKLGRYHYPPYEPEKYKAWSEETGLAYHFGNGILKSPDEIAEIMTYYPDMFWMHADYRSSGFQKIEDLVERAKKVDIPVIIHPANFIANEFVNTEFKNLQELAKQHSVIWKSIH
jgi:hypothetical protein